MQSVHPKQHRPRPIDHLARLATLLHPVLAAAWLLAALAALARPAARAPAVAAALAAALLLALVPPQLDAGGWWLAMPEKARLGLPAVAITWAALAAARHPHVRFLATLAGLVLAGFHLAFGAIALDNATPVPGFVALKSILAGVAILATLALTTRARRAAAVLLAVALLGAAAIAATHWAPAIPAEGLLG
jgi:hypothetical protein